MPLAATARSAAEGMPWRTLCYSGGQPWRVEAVHQGGATLADLAGSCVAAPLASLAPDPVQTPGAATSAAGNWGT